MDKELLRRLGFSEELIEVAVSSTRSSYPPVEGVSSSLDVSSAGAGTSVLDLSGAPVVGTTVLVPNPALKHAGTDTGTKRK